MFKALRVLLRIKNLEARAFALEQRAEEAEVAIAGVREMAEDIDRWVDQRATQHVPCWRCGTVHHEQALTRVATGGLSRIDGKTGSPMSEVQVCGTCLAVMKKTGRITRSRKEGS